MLQNEKYKGDALLQKTYTVDFFNKKRSENKWQVNQYIDSDTSDTIQLEIQRRQQYRERHRLKYYIMQKADNPFTTKVICSECGSAYGRKNWTFSKGVRKVWQCNNIYWNWLSKLSY